MAKQRTKYKVQRRKRKEQSLKSYTFGCLIFLCGIFFVVPVLSQDSLTEQLDQHLEQFDPFQSTGKVESAPEEKNIPKESLIIESVEGIKSDIFLEEDSLENIEEQLREAEIALWQTENKKGDIESQIRLLDQELSLIQSQLKTYTSEENKLREQLEFFTKQKSDLEALVRVKQREYDRFAVRNFLRTDHWQGRVEPNPEPSSRLFLLRWLFSDRSLSDVISDYQRQEALQKDQQQLLESLRSLKSQLALSEKQFAYRYAVASQLASQIARHKKNITTFTDAQVELQNRLDLSVQNWEQKVAEYRAEQAESTLVLQDLRTQLSLVEKGEVSSQNQTVEISSSPLIYPVKKPIRVTAYFHDQAYEREFGIRHDAVDFASPQGSQVYAVRDGVVSKIKDNGLGYSYVIIEHEKDMFTLYGHVSSFLVSEGQRVSQGDVIALSGGTPGTKGAGFFTTGPHLHFEVFKNGKYIDPLRLLPSME